MDTPLFLTFFLFAVQTAAGVAPMRWPEHKWLAGIIFWLSGAIAIVCLCWWAFTNREMAMALFEPKNFIALGLLIAVAALGYQHLQTKPDGAQLPPTKPPQMERADGASLHLQLRQNQDPSEIGKDNVWRWFVFKTMGMDAKKKPVLIGTYIFLVFDKPVPTNYRKVFSSSHPNIRFQIIEFTERSMVIFAPDAELDTASLEVQVSGKPI